MPVSPDRADFFIREAGEYLTRLTPILAGEHLSALEEFVRLARALRGATLMAGPQGLVRATSAFEGTAKALQGGALPWQGTVIAEIREARSTLESLVNRTAAWGDEERQAVGRLAQALESLLGESTAASTPPSGISPSGPTTGGVRTFVMREAARIARATEELLTADGGPTPESLRGVLDRMHAIRGLALPRHFHALTLVLESLESLLGDLLRGYPSPLDLGPILTTATLALLRAAEGCPGEELPAEVVQLGALVCAALAEERDVVPMAHLLLDPVPLMAPETAPTPPPDPVDLVSLGDRLRHLASQLRTPDRAVLPFHVQTLAALLRSLRAVVDRDPAGPAVREIARAIRRGEALANPEAFASALLAMAQPLTAATSITMEDVARDLALATTLLPRGQAPQFSPLRDAAAPVPAPPRPTTDPVEGTVFPERTALVPIGTLLLPPDPAARTAFEVSFSTLHRRRHGMDQVALAGIPDAPATPAIPPAVTEAGEIVPIEQLLYRGTAAATRLGELQVTLRTFRSPDPTPETLAALLDECVDLIPLALDRSR